MDTHNLTKKQRWKIADRMAEEYLGKVNEILPEVTPRNSVYTKYVKRLLDILISALALTVTLPINLVIGIVTFFDVGRPIFFTQQRAGRNGKTFTIVKFRNMRNTTDEKGELLPAAQRVTKFGKFVRKTSLDELLNFWSVLKGDMSIIGPRPLVPEYVHRYSRRHAARLAVRPGLECPPRKDSDHVWTWNEQFENDVWYVENVSFRTDCFMIGRLVKFALNRKSANARATAARGTFTGYTPDGRAINMDEVPEWIIEECLREEDETKK